MLESDSTNAMAKWGLALVVEQQGRPDQVFAMLEPMSGSILNRKASLGHAYAVSGKTDRAQSTLAELQKATAQSYLPSYYFAVVYAGLRQRDQAQRYLERAYEERSTVLADLWIDPDSRRCAEARFVALAKRLGGE